MEDLDIDILIVSSSEVLRDDLTKILREEFRTNSVRAVATAEEGKREIQRLAEEDRMFDVLILELDHLGEYEKLCLLVNSGSPDALVVHLEDTKSDIEAQPLFQHLAILHTEPDTSRSLVISKRDSGWGTTLLARLRSYLYERETEVMSGK